MRHLLLLAFLAGMTLAAQFNRVLQLTVLPPDTPQTATVTLGKKGEKPTVTITVNSRFVLTDASGEKPRILLDAPLPKTTGKRLIHLWMADDKTQLALDDRAVADGLPVPKLPSRPAIISSHPAITEAARPIFQRMAPINFQDDFARTAAEASLWDTVAGSFALNMALNPDSASGAFQLWGQATDGEGIAIASSAKWFWRDFTFGASIHLADDADACGLVFAFRDKDNFCRLEISRADSIMRMVRRTAGKDTVLEQRHCRMPSAAWTRLAISTHDGAVTATLGGRRLLRRQTSAVHAGHIGLYLKNASAAYFDDIAVTSATAGDTPFGPCEQRWSDLSGKHFFTDPFMSQWAHPRSFWHDGADKLQWFRSHMFNDVTFAWKRPDSQKKHPVRSCRIRIFADEEHLDKGFLLEIQKAKAVLKLDNAVIAEGPAPADIDSVNITAGQDIAVKINSAPALAWNAPATAFRKGAVAADFGRTSDMRHLHRYDWRDAASVSSSHRLDYSFEHAPAAWFPQAGSWKATHRWACVPKWSFFAGRGIPGPTGVKNGNTILWNLRSIVGDFDLELFAAPMEGTPQRAHFTYPLNINVAFAADGTNLDSGYTLVNGLYDFPSRLYQGDKLLATSDARVAPGLRLQDIPWYQRVTRVWQHIRIQRRNGRILVDSASHDDHANYIPLKREFDVKDTSASDEPSQFALWTWGENGLAIARATLSFQSSPGAAPIPENYPKPRVCQGNGTSAPRTYRRVVNPISGGQFAAEVWDTPFRLEPGTIMEMLVKLRSPRHFAQPLPQDMHLSLLVSANGQTAEAPICGPADIRRDYTFPISAGLTPIQGKPGWLKLTANLATIGQHFQPGQHVVIDAVAIASPYDSVEEIAGLGINPAGASIEYTCPQFFPNAVQFKLRPPRRTPQPTIYGQRIFNDFEDDIGDFKRLGGTDGAALLRVADGERGYVLRLLNQSVGGTAGAVITHRPFSLDAFPKLAFDYRIPVGLECNIIAVTDSGELEIGITPGASSNWPVVGNADITQDGAWHHAEIDLAALLKPRMKAPFVIRKLLLADSGRMSSYQRLAMYLDNVQFIPAIADGTEIAFANPGTEAAAVCFDNAPDTAPDTAAAIPGATVKATLPKGGAMWMHVCLKRNGAWQNTAAHLRIETAAAPVNAAIPADAPAARPTPPPPPVISYIPSDRLTRTTFEPADTDADSAVCFQGFETRREAWVIHNDQTAATGKHCGELVNLDDDGFCSIFFRKAPWDITRYPCVSFNYRFKQPGCALHLSMLVNDAMTIVEWTGPNARANHFEGSVIGKVDNTYALQDDQWHESAFNLLELLKKERYAHGIPPSGLFAAELATWATVHVRAGGGYANPENARVFFDNFTIYSNKGRNPAFEWSTHTDDAGYAVAFDQKPDTVPDEKNIQTAHRADYPGTAPGIWHFHVRVKDKTGAWSQPAHKQIIIE